MANGIYIYAEYFENKVEECTAELVKAAKSLKTNMPITVFAFGKEEIVEQLQWKDVSSLIISTDEEHSFEEAGRAEIIADIMKEKEPAIIILPATSTAKSLFSRVSVLLDVGMTADTTDLYMDAGIFKQQKPAFGNNVMVVTEEIGYPAVVTVVPGIFEKESSGMAKSMELLNRHMPVKQIEFLGVLEQQTESIVNANRIISLGRGILKDDGFEKASALAGKMGAVIGGTRPLVDNGMIPFESQIGQTGCVVHPDFCLFLGVSGAIQHTEGVRDTSVTIAVNNDPDAAIFTYADYGIIGDVQPVMHALLEYLK